MASVIVPHKGCRLGMALQDGLNDPATVATVVWPLPDGADFMPKWSKTVYQNGQGNYERTHYYQSGYVAEGGIKFPWVPGMLTGNTGSAGAGSALFRWMFDRGADAACAQGRYATIFMDYGGNYSYIADVKCASGSIDMEKGAPLYITAQARGAGQPITASDAIFPSYSTGVYFTAAPYFGDEMRLTLGAAVGGYELSEWTKGHSLEWDNHVMDAGDASTVSAYRGSGGPYALPNTQRASWSGKFTRWFVDNYLPGTAIGATYEGTYQMVITKGAAVGTFTFPRIIYMDGFWPGMPGDGIVVNEPTFEALGGLGLPGAHAFTFVEA